MPKLSSRLFITILFLLPISSQALDATITKVVDDNNFLQAILITTKDIVFRVSVYGIIEKVTPNNPKIDAQNKLRKALGKPEVPYPTPLRLKYIPSSASDGNSGKLAAVNDITIAYYPCAAANQTLNRTQYYGQNMSPSPNSTETSPLTINPRYRNACPNVSSNGGKVQSIGDIAFGYYSNTTITGNAAGNAGKLQRIGNIIIIYYPQNSFQGKGGQLQSFGSSS